jgi:hypothetical protein
MFDRDFSMQIIKNKSVKFTNMCIHINKLYFILLFPKVKIYKQGIKLKLLNFFGMIYVLIFTCPIIRNFELFSFFKIKLLPE